MRIYTLIMLFMCSFISSYSQSYYYDAKEIAENKEKFLAILSEQDEINDDFSIEEKDILQNFQQFLTDPFNNDLKPIDYSNITALTNKIVNGMNSKDFKIHGNPKSHKYQTPVETPNPLTTIQSGVSLTTKLIDATALYLVERTQEELTIAFFDKFRDRLNNLPELNAMFPNTFKMLQTQDYFQIPSMGDTWLSAIKSDLQSIPCNLGSLLKTDDRFKKAREKDIIKAMIYIMDIFRMQQEGMHPAEIINSIQIPIKIHSDIDKFIKFIKIFSGSLRSNSYDSPWIKISELNALSSIEKKYFYGLIYQELKELDIYPINYEMNVVEFEYIMNGCTKLYEILTTTVNSLHELASDKQKNSVQKYFTYLENLYNIFNFGIDLKLDIEKRYKKEATSNYQSSLILKSTIQDVLNIGIFLVDENYGKGLLYTIKLIEKITMQQLICSQEYENIKDKLNYKYLTENDMMGLSPETKILINNVSKRIEKTLKFVQEIKFNLAIDEFKKCQN